MFKSGEETETDKCMQDFIILFNPISIFSSCTAGILLFENFTMSECVWFLQLSEAPNEV